MHLPSPLSFPVLAVISLCATACTSTTPDDEAEMASESRASEQSSELVVVALQHAPADEVARVLSNSIDSRKVRIQAYARTNSLILAGAASDLEPVKLLISKLDVQAK